MTSVKQPKQGLSSANPRGRALLPFGTVVTSCCDGINSYTSSNELGAQYVQLHQKTIKSKKDHTWKACACLCCCAASQTLKLRWKRSFWLFSTASRSRKCSNQDSLGQQEQQESPKTVHNRKASCFTLPK